MRPGLATEWKPSSDYRSWTFKLRPGVMFHDDWDEFTAEDVKFTVEQNLKPNATGGSAPFFRDQLEKIETPDKYTAVMFFKSPVWEVPTHFGQRTGYQNITSKKYLETVGEDKARDHPIGTGPFKYVEGRQGDFHRFEAVPNHWRQTPGFKELVIRKIANQATTVSGLRAGEIDLAQLSGDYLDQTKQAGLRTHEVPGSTQYWIVLPGQTLPDKPDYSPQSPWVGDPNDAQAQENARKVRLALNLAINKKEIIDGLWKGYGAETPFAPWYYPTERGYSQEWKVPPYDPTRAKQLLTEAGYPNGFEITVSGQTQVIDGPDVMEAVALDWEKLGLKVKRYQEDWTTFLPKVRARKTGVIAFPYGAPGPLDEASLSWQRTLWIKGTFYLLAESPEYDKAVEAILRETEYEKRNKLQAEFGQKLYDEHRNAMIGVKSTTYALNKKVGEWPTLIATLWENNFEYITWSGQ